MHWKVFIACIIYMDISLKLSPYASDQLSLEPKYLRIPVSFTYEDKNGSFNHGITDGLPIIGKQHPETGFVSYFVGDVCTIEQLTGFINDLLHNVPCNITFSETDETINTVEYDPQTEQWKHKTGSKIGNFGSTLTMKLNDTSLKQFTMALDNYRKFAFVNIEGHKRLSDSDD